MLDREEYVEQAYFFRALGERLLSNTPIQDMLSAVREELLASTRLPLAVDFLLSELRHAGVMGSAMERLPHYFAPFQTYVVHEAERAQGRFDMRIAVQLLQREAQYRADGKSQQGLFLYQFEAICRNRLRYDPALAAMAHDPAYDANWREWILTLRRQIGLIDLADMIFVRSAHYQARRGGIPPERPVLFGEKEGRIALANRRKDTLLLFAALQRHLGYPAIPRVAPADNTSEQLPLLIRRMERLETRMKMLEEESRHGSIDLASFYDPPGTSDG